MSFSSKPILFVLVRIRRQPAAAVSVSDSFNSCIQRIEQNKQQCLFHFPVLEKRPYFAYSLTQSRFAFYFGTTPFIANLLSGGILDQTEARRAEKNVFETAPSYLRVWTLSPPHPHPLSSEGLDRHCSSFFYRIPIQERHFVHTLDCEIVPGGTPGNSCWWCAARFSKSWSYFRPKNVIFHTCFQTWPLKSLPVFRPGGGDKRQQHKAEIMPSLLRLIIKRNKEIS